MPGTMSECNIFCGLYGVGIRDKGLGVIRRWHALFALQKETVASHTYDVLETAWIIGQLLLGRGFQVDMLTLLEQALFHDTEESETGDIPHSFKIDLSPEERKAFEEVVEKKALKVIEERFPLPLGEIASERWRTVHRGDTLEAEIIRVADLFSMVNFLERETLRLSNGLVRGVLIERVREMIQLKDKHPWLAKIWEEIFGQTPEEIVRKVEGQ